MDPMRTMAFIDGENLVCRYQESVKAGKKPAYHVQHVQDAFVWSRSHLVGFEYDVVRAHYYTSTVGDEASIEALRTRIKSQFFAAARNGPLYPVIAARLKGRSSGKGLDVRFATDALTQTWLDNLDVLLLGSGDGDFVPVVDAAIQRGKRVIVIAFSNGLSPRLLRHADEIIYLDGTYFEQEPQE